MKSLMFNALVSQVDQFHIRMFRSFSTYYTSSAQRLDFPLYQSVSE